MKKISALLVFVATFFVLGQTAFAHVVVKPGEVLTGGFQTYTTGVPNEKGIPTTAVKVLIPASLQYVSPTVKPGWTIDIEKTGEGESAKVISITWSGGSIPAGQRDDFTFSGKAPDTESTLQWKAYQTYEDGEVVAWDQDPATAKGEEIKPFSVTKVVKTASTAPVAATKSEDDSSSSDTANSLSVVAFAISLGALFLATRKPQTVAAPVATAPAKAAKPVAKKAKK